MGQISDFVHKMLEKFPDASLEADDSGWIPLHYAAHFGNVDVVELFLQKNNSIAYEKDNEGMCALHISAREGKVGVMRAIIKKCPDTCELLDDKHRTALHLAVESGSINAVKLFLETVAFQDLINEQDKNGNTPLHLAALHLNTDSRLLLPIAIGSPAPSYEHYKILKILAHDRRLDKWTRNEEGMTTAHIIQSNNRLLWFEKAIIMITCNLEGVDDGQTPKEVQTVENKGASMATDDQDNISKFSLMSITIITTVTYAAAFQLPGGYDSNTGKPVLRNHTAFQSFLLFNSVSFVCSAAAMFMHYIKSGGTNMKTGLRFKIWLHSLTYFSICSMFFAYIGSMLEIVFGSEVHSRSSAPPPK